MPEPTAGGGNVEPIARLSVRYPGGPRDAESLFVLPNGELYVLTRGRDHPIALYRYPMPLRPDETVELELVRAFSSGKVDLPQQVTAADASPDGGWVALRRYGSLLIYRTSDLISPEGLPALDVPLAPLGQPQGEAVSIRADGTVTLTSEGQGNKTPATVAVLRCTLPDASP